MSKNYAEIWREGNNKGEGFALDGDEINSIEGLGELVIHSEDNDGFAVYHKGDMETIVADANGPWAVLA